VTTLYIPEHVVKNFTVFLRLIVAKPCMILANSLRRHQAKHHHAPIYESLGFKLNLIFCLAPP